MRHIHDYQHQVATLERLAHLDHHLAAEGTVGPVNSWRIDQDNLAAIFALAFALGNVNYALNAVARGLRLGRDDGQLLAHERIEQSGLARVGAAEDTNETGAKGHGDQILASIC